LRSTTNFSCDSMWVTHLIGGLNYQIEHHLFQSIHHYHYPALRKIVKSTIDEYNLKHKPTHPIPYYEFRGYADALYSHYKLLKKLSIP
jgi:linoleoyl-CoA desaturase